MTLAVLGALGLVASRFGLSAIPAYLLAGLLLGPNEPRVLSVIEPSEVTEFVAELGLVFLLFFLGLEFALERVLRSGRHIGLGGSIDLVVNAGLGLLVGLAAFGPSFAALLLAAGVHACVAYEYEHEFWIRVDGSGTVNVTGRPGLWTAFKGLGKAEDPDGTATRQTARDLFERSGLRVRRVTLTRREGRPYLFVSADFDDINRLAGTPAFPDLRIVLRREAERLHLEGEWERPSSAPDLGGRDRDGLMAVRFHLPSKVYHHRNAFAGVERGNIVGWRQDVSQGLEGDGLEFGATMDRRSILMSTVGLFAGAIALGLAILGGGLYWVLRRGRKDLGTPS